MKKDSDSARSRARPRKKGASVAAPVAPVPVSAPESAKNIGSLESSFSLLLGALLVLAALFPRSIKQVLMLGMGGGLVYRGMTSHCGLYQALGVSAVDGSVIRQVREKYLSSGQH